jgi:transposase-like protein
MNPCPYCQKTESQIKVGLNASGSQRYQYQGWGRKYTPSPTEHGYPEALRQQAVRLYVDGMNFRRIARQLGVHHQTVINWMNAHSAQLPPAPVPDPVTVVEQDELYTFIGHKKTRST